MNGKTLISLALAVVFGLVAAVVGRNLLQQRNRPVAAEPSKKYAQIVAAARDVAPGQELSEADLTLVEMSLEALPRTSFQSTEKIPGRIAIVPLVKGQPLLESALAEPGTGRGMQAVVPDGMRAVTIEVNEVSGLAGLLTPGCQVDVISTIRRSENNLARTIVENVKVMAIGPNTVVKDKEGKSDAENLRSVTLLVTPKQAETIELACSQARPRLVLRGSGDDEPIVSTGVTANQLIGPIEQGTSSLAMLLDRLAAMQPTTRPVEASTPVAAAPPEPVVLESIQRSVQVIRAGAESMIHYEIFPDGNASTAVTRANGRWTAPPAPTADPAAQNDPFVR